MAKKNQWMVWQFHFYMSLIYCVSLVSHNKQWPCDKAVLFYLALSLIFSGCCTYFTNIFITPLESYGGVTGAVQLELPNCVLSELDRRFRRACWFSLGPLRPPCLCCSCALDFGSSARRPAACLHQTHL